MNLFEMEIEKSIEHLEDEHVLLGEKIREKIPFGRKFSTGRSKFDFWVLFGGMFYGLECKMQRNKNSFSLSDISIIDDAQITTLFNVERMGGQGVLGLRSEEDKKECFFVRIKPILEYLRAKKTKTVKLEVLRRLSFVHVVETLPVESTYTIWNIRKIKDLPNHFEDRDMDLMREGRLVAAPYDEILKRLSDAEEFDELLKLIEV